MTNISQPICHIIGVLDNGVGGITPDMHRLIAEARVVVGGTRTLKLFAQLIASNATQYDLTGKLSSVPAWVNDALEKNRAVVVLATGDPLCFGIARYVIDRVPPGRCVVMPNVSTAQLAFARLHLAWQDARIVSAHSHDSGEWSVGADARHALYPVLQATRLVDRLAIFTSPQNTPARIARMLQLESFGAEWRFAVANGLLQEGESIQGPMTITEATQIDSEALNVVVLWRDAAPSITSFGLKDDSYAQRKPEKGLITKREIRAVSLAYLQLRADSIVWDIGAGSGSVGLEAARLCTRGHVYAAEKNIDDCANARENAQRLAVHNYTLAHTKAPAGLNDWLDPDAVFIGGSGGELEEIITYCLQRMKPGGHLVMNFVTVENLAATIATLKSLNVSWNVTQMQVSRSQPILDMHRFAAENPVWIVTAQKADA